jgi:hypothetical protein
VRAAASCDYYYEYWSQLLLADAPVTIPELTALVYGGSSNMAVLYHRCQSDFAFELITLVQNHASVVELRRRAEALSSNECISAALLLWHVHYLSTA